MDLDIDVDPRVDLAKIFPDSVTAAMVLNGEYKKHPAGRYFQNIPIDKETNLASIPYDKAADNGYHKIDFLNLSVLEHFTSKQEMDKYLQTPPDWSLLSDADVVSKLFHISNHFDLLNKVKPTSVEDLADVLALIRPNKLRLLDKYLIDKNKTRIELYLRKDKTDLRKPHALAYALVIVLQLHLISEGRL